MTAKNYRCLLAAAACEQQSGCYSLPTGMPYIAAVMKKIEGVEIFCVNLNAMDGDEAEHVDKELLAKSLPLHYISVMMLPITASRGCGECGGKKIEPEEGSHKCWKAI